MSMATTRPFAIVKPKATRGVPPGTQTRPTAPSTIAGRAAWARAEKVRATAAAPRISGSSTGAPLLPPRLARRDGDRIGAEHHIGVEHSEQRVDVAIAGGGEKRLDNFASACVISRRLDGTPIIDVQPVLSPDIDERG